MQFHHHRHHRHHWYVFLCESCSGCWSCELNKSDICCKTLRCIVDRELISMSSDCLCRWMNCCTSWESRYCWQPVGWRWALRWRLKCDLMSTSTSDFRLFVIASTRSSGTNASVASSSDISNVCLHSLNINDNFISLVMLLLLLFNSMYAVMWWTLLSMADKYHLSQCTTLSSYSNSTSSLLSTFPPLYLFSWLFYDCPLTLCS